MKALIVAQHEQILSKDEQLLRKEEQLSSLEEEIERLKLLIAKLWRIQFGRKSEKLEREIEQLELKLDELEASRAQQALAATTPLATSAVNRTAKRARQPLPTHLPRETLEPNAVSYVSCHSISQGNTAEWKFPMTSKTRN